MWDLETTGTLRFRVYLTGHMIWVHAGAFAILFHSMGLNDVATVATASIVDGAYMTFVPAIALDAVARLTGAWGAVAVVAVAAAVAATWQPRLVPPQSEADDPATDDRATDDPATHAADAADAESPPHT